ncbi:MAG: aromatic ring-hydroxylating dioxygenase subunit alpha [Pseudomonadota bacterium]
MHDGYAHSETDPRAKRASDTALIKHVWRLAGVSSDIKPGQLKRVLIAGEPVVIGRTKTGEDFALRDVCPHRAAPLSQGRIVETTTTRAVEVECPYHGWRFGVEDGRCTAAPALSERAGIDTTKIATPRYHIHHANGLLWVCLDEPGAPPPDIGLHTDRRPDLVTIVDANGPYDEAVIGLIDPAHTPYVHKQWWWRDGKAAEEKTKTFEPTPLGFRMPPHKPSSNSRIYAMIGGAPTTEIEFRLPGLRIETIRNQKHTFVGVTVITPIEKGRNRITHLIYWDLPILTLMKPVLARMSRSFLAQDGAILDAQATNLARFEHTPLYLGDPDTPARWYYQLKRAWNRADIGAFINPLKEDTLHWKT